MPFSPLDLSGRPGATKFGSKDFWRIIETSPDNLDVTDNHNFKTAACVDGSGAPPLSFLAVHGHNV